MGGYQSRTERMRDIHEKYINYDCDNIKELFDELLADISKGEVPVRSPHPGRYYRKIDSEKGCRKYKSQITGLTKVYYDDEYVRSGQLAIFDAIVRCSGK